MGHDCSTEYFQRKKRAFHLVLILYIAAVIAVTSASKTANYYNPVCSAHIRILVNNQKDRSAMEAS
jgi:hypothetical protein